MPTPNAVPRANLRRATQPTPTEPSVDASTPTPTAPPRPSGARAARGTATRTATVATAPRPAPQPEPELAADDTDDADDDAFGPEGVLEASAATETPTPVSRATSIESVPVRATSERTAIALPQENLSTQVTNADLVMPKLMLSQGTSDVNKAFRRTNGEQGVQEGNWYVTLTGRNLGDTVHFVPVHMYRQRSYYVTGEGVQCRSRDMLQGEGNPGILCEGTREERELYDERERGCELRLWNGKTAPQCGVTFFFPGYVILDLDKPEGKNLVYAELQMRGTHISRARQLITLVQSEADQIWRNAIIELGIEEQSNPKGTWYTPTVSFFDTTEGDEFKRFRRQADRAARQWGAIDPVQYVESGTDE